MTCPNPECRNTKNIIKKEDGTYVCPECGQTWK